MLSTSTNIKKMQREIKIRDRYIQELTMSGKGIITELLSRFKAQNEDINNLNEIIKDLKDSLSDMKKNFAYGQQQFDKLVSSKRVLKTQN